MRKMKDSGVEWLGEVPAEWDFDRLGSFFALRNERVSDEEYIPLSVTMGGVVPQLSHVAKSDDHANRKLVCKGDFAINSRSDRRNSCGFASQDGSVSLINTICVPRGEIESRYFGYLFDSSQWSDEFYSWGHGIVADLWTTGWNDMKKILLPVPPLDEQRRIADCLDEKCAEIDRAVSAAEQSIEEYRAYQNDVVKRAIVYGTCNAFKVKESGVPAIGKMNASWSLVMVKRLAVFLNGDRSDSYPSGDDIQETGIPFITSGDLNGRYLPDVFSKYISQDKYDSLKGVKLQRGDVVFCLRGSVGKCSLNRTENCGTVASSLTVARPICCAPEWLSYALTCLSTTNQAMATAIGATSANLAANVLARAFVPLPPLSEQRRIADYLDEKCAQIDAAIAAKQAIITDLKAYKQSLIYEAVTGKREV